MYAESHHVAELTQMAGRVRNGLDKFFVIYDAAELISNTSRYDERLALVFCFCYNRNNLRNMRALTP